MRASSSRRIVFTAYDGVSLLDLSGPLEAFTVATDFALKEQRTTYECIALSARGGRVKTANGVELNTKSARSVSGKTIDTLIVLGALRVEDVTRDRALVQWVRKTAPACRRICSVCVGSFLLAAAGILDGRRAATHWMHASLLASRHPKVTVEPDAIYVHDRKVWSSAGSSAGIDLALALIEQDAGHEVAIKVARILVVYLKRAGGQSQYSALLDAQAHSDSDQFNELEQWIAEHLRSDLRVEALADRLHMSPRNFARVYMQTRGRTPAKAIEAIRLDTARRRLEETTDRIETIAEGCGFSGEEQMRLAFVRSLGISPREYRKRFASAS
ncbi:MAG TPA: GlxA family transcriptional regulator [Terriglobales bacterium]|jgi:transcriptional regulator GlxA family with amidase domain|nr:GlxA family transcriptional regulator [Terriglobales bacterium]